MSVFEVRPPPTNSTNPLLVPHHRFSAPIVRHSIDSRSAKKNGEIFHFALVRLWLSTAGKNGAAQYNGAGEA